MDPAIKPKTPTNQKPRMRHFPHKPHGTAIWVCYDARKLRADESGEKAYLQWLAAVQGKP